MGRGRGVNKNLVPTVVTLILNMVWLSFGPIDPICDISVHVLLNRKCSNGSDDNDVDNDKK